MIEFNSIDEFRSLVLSIVRPMLMSSVLFTGEASAYDPATNTYTVIPDDPLLPQMTHVKMVGGIDFPNLSGGPVLCCFDSRRNVWIIGPDDSAITSVGHSAVLGDKLVSFLTTIVSQLSAVLTRLDLHTHVSAAVGSATSTAATSVPPIVFATPALSQPTGLLSNTLTVKE